MELLSLLNRMKLPIRRQAFDRLHLTALRFNGEDQTGIDETSVEDDRAGPALPFAAPLFRACQPQMFTHQLEQGRARIDEHFVGLAIDGD